MKAATSEQLKSIDKYCNEQLKIPMIVLMENAALRLFENVNTTNRNSYCIVCGNGNNGGDGLALARHLHVKHHKVKVFFIGDIENGTTCCKTNYAILKKMGIEIFHIDREPDIHSLQIAVKYSNIVVDAVFGIGLNRAIAGLYYQTINSINQFGKEVVSVDIPSGLNCNTGQIMGICVKADKTISFETYKVGFFNYNAVEYIGDVIVESIGIPENVINKFCTGTYVTDSSIVKSHIKKRGKLGHKGSFGRTIVMGGSRGYYGALLMAVTAASKSGSGLVTAAGSSDVVDFLSTRLTESMSVDIKDPRFDDVLCKCSGAAIGPGIGVSEESTKLLHYVINNSKCPVVIDADGLNILAKHKEWLYNAHQRVIVTPHPAEMARLTGETTESINNNRIEAAKAFATGYSVIVLLKGYNTIITDGETVFINPTGSSAMSSGGMGDCLTGIISSFLSQGLDPLYAAVCAAYIHGYCGDTLAKTMYSVTATDIINQIPFTLKELTS